MRIETHTVRDRTDVLQRRLNDLNGKVIEVGVFDGEQRWLAHIHEFGCTITPKNGKYLTVPVHPDAKGKRASDFQGLFVYKSHSGEKMLARNENGSLVCYYWLATSVNIPERSFLRSGHDTHANEVMTNAERGIGQVIGGAMNIQTYLDMIGQMLATKIKTFARDLQQPPNSGITQNVKGSSNPLVDTGQMINSITWRVIG